MVSPIFFIGPQGHHIPKHFVWGFFIEKKWEKSYYLNTANYEMDI